MRIVYVSRHFNRSGYYILEHLLEARDHVIAGVVLPKPSRLQWLDQPVLAPIAMLLYHAETHYYRGKPVRFMKSIKRLAHKYGVPAIELGSLKTRHAYELLMDMDPDLVVAGGGWPELLPERVFRVARLGAINTHPSLLPEFRGTDVHRWQIYRGGSRSGVTIHFMDEAFDTGHILDQSAIEIDMDDTPQSLFEKAARAAVPLMKAVLDRLENADPGTVPGTKQGNGIDGSTYCGKWQWCNSDFLQIDWAKSAEELWRFIRACYQESFKYRGPFFIFRGKEYVVREASLAPCDGGRPGQICSIGREGIGVHCGDTDTDLVIRQIQRWGTHRAWHRAHEGAWFAKTERLKLGDNLRPDSQPGRQHGYG